MAGFRLDVFKGIRPRVNARTLPEGESQIASNVRLGSGSLEPWKDLLQTAEEIDQLAVAIHRLNNNGSPFWLSSRNDVDYARGPVPNDELERTYYTGEEQPRMTYAGLAPGYRYLGIPAPETAPTLSGDPLPDDIVSGSMTAGSLDTKFLKADFCIEDNLPASLNGWFMGQDSGYDAPGTVRVFNMDFFAGQQIRIASVVDTNTVTLEAADGAPYLARTTQQARATGGGITQFRTDDTGTSRDGHFRFYVPNGVQVTFPSHGLQEGDVIRVTSIPSTVALKLTQVATGTPTTAVFFGAESDNGAGTAGSNTWPSAPISVSADDFWIEGNRAYPFVDVWAAATGAAGSTMFDIQGNFTWELIERDGEDYTSIATDIESRVYVYTFVSDIGEEGPPSPPSDVVTIPTAGEVEVGSFATPPSDHRSITHMRIYRANTGTDNTVFQFVAEIASPFSTYTDNVADVDLGEVLQTESWEPPPTDLEGIITLPNGGMAGFMGKTVCFAEPYYPHAWPPEYQIAVDHEVIGLGIIPNGVAILTKGPVYIAAGDHPRAMSTRHFNNSQACSSKRSIANTLDGVLYSCPDGLAFVGSGGFKLVTESFVTKREWQANFEPTAIKGFWHDSKYIGFHTTGGFVFDPDDLSVGLTTHDITARAGYVHAEEDELYVVGSGAEYVTSDTLVVAIATTSSDTNLLARSTNGSTWAQTAAPAGATWKGICYSRELSLFVIVGNTGAQRLGTSPDTDTWTLRTVPLANWNSVTWSPELNLFVAVAAGTTSGVLTSPDGVTWTARTCPSKTWITVKWIPELARFVAGASDTGSGQADNVMTSPDGITWTSQTTPANRVFAGFAYDPVTERLVAANSPTEIWYSEDGGVTWEEGGEPFDNVHDVAVNPETGRLVWVRDATDGEGGNLSEYSTDGANTVTTGDLPNGSYQCVIYSSALELFITFDSTATAPAAYTSEDGITWTKYAFPTATRTYVDAAVRDSASFVHVWDGHLTDKLTMTWKSGKTICPHPLNLGAARVVADAYPVTFKLYNDRGNLVTTRTVASDEVFRLPGGYLTSWFEIQIEGTNVVRTVHVAETVHELLAG